MYVTKRYKTALNRMKYIDSWFWCRYTINPYGGCEHACIYCDARSNRYYMHHDFEETIYIKEEIDRVLETQIKNSKVFLPDVVAMAGVCDAYQKSEETFRNTQKILKILMKYKFPVNISTKSDLIIQDLELFNKIAQDTWASIAFTITTLDEETEHFLEPGATPSRKRLEAIKLIHDNYPKIHVGVNFMPIVPFLEDSEENLERVVKESKQNGADYIHFAPGMTLRDNQRDFFLTKLRDFYPGLVEKYQNLYGDNSQPTSTYLQKLNKQLMTLCKQYDLATRLKRWIPEDFRKKNYRIAERLLNEAYYDKIQGRSYFNMQRVGLAIGNLKIPIDQLYTTGFLHQIEYMDDNVLKKIKPFLKKNKTVLDYF